MKEKRRFDTAIYGTRAQFIGRKMFVKYIRDPVHGYIGMTDVERRVIDTPVVQRLRGIKQLSVASVVYPGAEHTRFSHSVGAMHVAGMMVDALSRTADISDDERQLIRLAALLHDVGHGPFSHSSEEILVKHRGLNHEELGKLVITKSELADVLRGCGYEPREIVGLGAKARGKRYMRQVISSQFDSDRMDFLVRDSYFTGVEYGKIDISRIVQAMEVVDGSIAVDLKALYALEAFMIARYEMFLAVYYHHAVRAAEIMLHRAMESVHDIIGLTTFGDISEFLELDDSLIMSRLRALGKGERGREVDVERARRMVEMLSGRKLLKPAYQRAVHVSDPFVARLLGEESVRRQNEEEIARRAGISPDMVFVDVPTLASVPLYPREADPMEIQVFSTSGGRRTVSRLSEHSRLVNVMRGYTDVIRVYTFPEHRERVERATSRVFRIQPLSARISM